MGRIERELKKIVFEFRKMIHLLVIFLLGNIFLTAVLYLLPKHAVWIDSKTMQVLFFLSGAFYIISVFAYELFVFTSIVRYFTGEYYLLEQLNGASIYKIFVQKLPVNLLLCGFMGMDYYGMNVLLPKYISDRSGVCFFDVTASVALLLVEGLVFGPILVAFIYLWFRCHVKYMAGFYTILVFLVIINTINSAEWATWNVCVVELVVSAVMLWKSQDIASSRYEQI